MSDSKQFFMGNGYYYKWNRKICFQAQETLHECIDKSGNGNKYRCPDELYAFEMYCPPEFQRLNSRDRRAEKLVDEYYNKEWLKRTSIDKAKIHDSPIIFTKVERNIGAV